MRNQRKFPARVRTGTPAIWSRHRPLHGYGIPAYIEPLSDLLRVEESLGTWRARIYPARTLRQE